LTLLLTLSLALAAPLAPQRDADTTLSGELSDGTQIKNEWAAQSSVACFPATRFQHFTGPTVHHTFKQPAGSTFIIEVDPSDGVDINMYVLQLGTYEKGARPPELAAAWRCTALYDAPAGEPERFQIGAPKSEMEVVIGVVGATTETKAGKYDVKIWDTTEAP